MPDFITLACPSCGAKLEITNDLDRFVCSYCGQEHIVRRGGGIVTLSPVIGAINQVQKGVDRTAAELALQRLPKEIAALRAEQNKIELANPVPDQGTWLGLSLAFGIIAFVIGMIALLASGSHNATGFICLLTLGFLGAAYGGFVIFYLHPRNQQYWEQKVRPQMKNLNEQIASKNSQLKYNHDLLAK